MELEYVYHPDHGVIKEYQLFEVELTDGRPDSGQFAAALVEGNARGDALAPPKTWFKYHCPSCDHADWIEDIIVDAFPPDGPGGTPILICPNCHGTYLRDTSLPETRSYTKPD